MCVRAVRPKPLRPLFFFWSVEKQAFLISYPSSGNSWMRLLLEYASGTYSGSVYKDDRLVPFAFRPHCLCGVTYVL